MPANCAKFETFAGRMEYKYAHVTHTFLSYGFDSRFRFSHTNNYLFRTSEHISPYRRNTFNQLYGVVVLFLGPKEKKRVKQNQRMNQQHPHTNTLTQQGQRVNKNWLQDADATTTS